jgi:hypothetical protein
MAKKDAEREDRIIMEVVVDAYDAGEQAMGWYYYLQETMQFPVAAVCVSKRRSSPLKEGATVEVVGMAPFDECEKEMFVEIAWEGDTLAVPLSQLQATETDEDTHRAIADWHYWVNRGYEFG